MEKLQRGLSLILLVKDIPDDDGGTLQSVSGHTCKFYIRKSYDASSESSATVDLSDYDTDQETRVEVRTPAQTAALKPGVYHISLRLKNTTSGQVIELLKEEDRTLQITEEATKDAVS